jgi:protein-tyrosine phosphatase
MGFAIFDIEIGAGRVALAPMPSEVDDIFQIAQWRADFVVSLTEINEGSTATMQNQLSSCGVGWVHVPIVDFGVPDTTSSEALDAVVANTIAALRQGRRVLFHCMGGCGRSGMAVMRVMHVMGVEDALEKLRKVRPCAVETEAQAAWALRPVIGGA